MSEEKRNILIVDDDLAHIKLIERILTTNGYDVVSANEAPVGLESAIKAPPDLIILDVMMPIINGFNICRLLKSEQGTKNVPVVLLTSRVEEEDRRIGEEVGADAYLLKPINTRLLLDKLSELLPSA